MTPHDLKTRLVPDPSSIRKVLVRATNWIGDAVMTTPALEAVRRAFPRAEIAVVANPLVSELLSPHPACDRTIVFDKKSGDASVAGFWRFCAKLRRERFDLAILFQNAFEAAVMARLAGIPRRAGYATDGRAILLTHAVPVGETERIPHHTRYYLNMLEGIGIEAGIPPLRLGLTSAEEEYAARLLGTAEVLVVNPGAAYGSAKRWLPDRFAAVADALAARYGFRVVLVGGPGENQIGADIERTMREPAINLIGKTTIRQMMAVLSRAELVVTNDSGPMHVAAAFDRRVLALFGPTDHTTTSPACAHHVIVRHATECAPCLKRHCPTDHRCMDAITPAEVIEAAATLLEGRLGR